MATWDEQFPAGSRHVAAVRDRHRLKLYVDGKLVAESRQPGAEEINASSTAPLRIGGGPHDYFLGTLSRVRLHARALAAEEIALLASQRH